MRDRRSVPRTEPDPSSVSVTKMMGESCHKEDEGQLQTERVGLELREAMKD